MSVTLRHKDQTRIHYLYIANLNITYKTFPYSVLPYCGPDYFLLNLVTPVAYIIPMCMCFIVKKGLVYALSLICYKREMLLRVGGVWIRVNALYEQWVNAHLTVSRVP